MSENVMSAAEWQVMRVVWAHPGATSQFIIEAVQEGFDWQSPTIKTLLGRLRKKGYLEMVKVDKCYQYHPIISEEEHLQGQVDLLLNNMCSTKHASLVKMLLTTGSFSRSDVQELSGGLSSMEDTAPERLVCHCLKGQCTCGNHCH